MLQISVNTIQTNPRINNSQLSQKRQILNSSKRKELVDDNSKFDKNGRLISRRIEDIVGK